MADDIPHAPTAYALGRLRGLRKGFALVGLLALLGLMAAACGGGPKGQGAAGGGTTTTLAPGSTGSTSPGQSSQSEDLQLAQCMRSNGVPQFPDPSPGGGLLTALAAAGINPNSPTFQEALQACKKYNPSANLSPAQSAAQNTEGLEISQCMRSHGVPNFPDPTTGPLGEQVINLRGTSIDPSSPTYQAASQACQKLFPGSK
jgi:hypothetical protein